MSRSIGGVIGSRVVESPQGTQSGLEDEFVLLDEGPEVA